MIQREWERNDGHAWLDSISPAHRPSSRAGVALMFWTYFETRMARLLRVGLGDARPALAEDFLERYWTVNARMNQAYRVLFDSSYQRDLEQLGCGDVWRLLREVQQARNSFMHGAPEAITDELVTRLVENLKREHEAWIAVFNHRLPPRPEGT